MKVPDYREGDGLYLDDRRVERDELVEFKLGTGFWVWGRFAFYEDGSGGAVRVPVEIAGAGGVEIVDAVIRLPPWALLRRLSK